MGPQQSLGEVSSRFDNLVAHVCAGKRMEKGEWSMEPRLIWKRNEYWKIESAMRDKRMNHKIDNGERIIYSTMGKKELRIEN